VFMVVLMGVNRSAAAPPLLPQYPPALGGFFPST